ncbi:hypothetical protein HZY97_12635 [Sphingomonas sp. R-74633]|uniref:hypothetical protein n=1 Tax=Sphingomonas sp. R-74633 TaxID=2751188 RepID=UPI0015D2EE6A|nr:hypothetical protein [Sphingomonas sp. R-74633]NYT41610.1 hypothetical protein [Sphingomonas sp. R-74633]
MSVLVLALLLQAVPDAPLPKGALVQVKPGPQRFFYDDAERKGCPARTPVCRRKAYVLPGDQLVATEVRGNFTQVTYVAPGRSDPTSGWIESDALRAVALPAPAPGSWLGSWKSWDNDIDITRSPARGALHITGSALWGSRDRDRVERGGVHVGQIEGDATPIAGMLTYYNDAFSDDCQVRIKPLGAYLVVTDNNRCGGANVSFTGTYRK